MSLDFQTAVMAVSGQHCCIQKPLVMQAHLLQEIRKTILL